MKIELFSIVILSAEKGMVVDVMLELLMLVFKVVPVDIVTAEAKGRINRKARLRKSAKLFFLNYFSFLSATKCS